MDLGIHTLLLEKETVLSFIFVLGTGKKLLISGKRHLLEFFPGVGTGSQLLLGMDQIQFVQLVADPIYICILIGKQFLDKGKTFF